MWTEAVTFRYLECSFSLNTAFSENPRQLRSWEIFEQTSSLLLSEFQWMIEAHPPQLSRIDLHFFCHLETEKDKMMK